MKTSLAKIALALLLGFGVIGCSGDGGAEGKPNPDLKAPDIPPGRTKGGLDAAGTKGKVTDPGTPDPKAGGK